MKYLLTNLGIYIALCVVIFPLYMLYLVIQEQVHAFRHRNDPGAEAVDPGRQRRAVTESEAHLAEFLVLVQMCLGLVLLIGIWAGIGWVMEFITERLKRWWKGRRSVRASRREKAP